MQTFTIKSLQKILEKNKLFFGEKFMMDSIIKPTTISKKIPVKFSLPEPLVERVTEYMEWAGFESQDNFMTECVNYLLESDKNFKRFLKEKSVKNN